MFPVFEHARFLADAWRHGPPLHNLGASAFVVDDPLEHLPTQIEPTDVAHFDLHAETAFRSAVAAHAGVPEDHVRPTVGTSGANLAVIAAHRKGGMVCERPYYAPMPHTATGLGMDVTFIDRDAGGALDPGAVADAIGPDTSIVALTSPNNPTGHAADADTLRHIGEAAQRHGAIVLVDQVYRELTDHALGATVHDAIISTASMNKCWGAPGLRAGWMVGSPERLAGLEEVHRLLMLGPSAPGTRLATVLLGHAAARRAAKDARLAANHAVYEAWCGERGMGPAHGDLTAFPHLGVDTEALAKRCAADGLLVLPGDVFGRPGHVRIGLGIPTPDLEAALAVFTW